MARSRHGHRAAESVGGTGLPSWAQRHLGEAGESAETVLLAAPSPSRHRRRAAPEPAHRLKGWGVAVVSVAAAVGAVPLAISSVAADRSDDPLPTVNTFTAGAPGPLESGGAGQGGMAQGGTAQGGTRTVPAPPAGDPSTGGILQAPAAPGSVARPAAPVPQPAAVVRPSAPAASSTTTAPARPLAGTSTTAPKPKPTTTTGGTGGSSGGDDGPRTAPKPAPAPAKPPASSSGPSNPPSGGSDGLLPAVGKTAGGVVGGLTNTVGGLL